MSADLKQLNHLALPLFGTVIANPVVEPSGAVPHCGDASRSDRARLAKKFRIVVSPDAFYAIDQIREFAYSRKSQPCGDVPDTTWGRRNALNELVKRIKTADQPPIIAHRKPFTVTACTREELVENCKGLLRRDGMPSTLQTQWVYLNDAFDLLSCLEVSVAPSDVTSPAARYTMYWRHLSAAAPLEYSIEPIDVLNAAIFRSGARCRFNSLTSSVRNERLIAQIRRGRLDISSQFTKYGTKLLASIFYQHKSLFLTFKESHGNNKPIINEVSHYAKTYKVTNPLSFVTTRKLDRERDYELLSGSDWRTLEQARLSCFRAFLRHKWRSYEHRYDKPWLDKNVVNDAIIDAFELNQVILSDFLKAKMQSKFQGRSVYVESTLETRVPLSERQIIGNASFSTHIHERGTVYTIGILDDSGQTEVFGISHSGERLDSTSRRGRSVRARYEHNSSLITLSGRHDGSSEGSQSLSVYAKYKGKNPVGKIRIFVVKGEVTKDMIDGALPSSESVIAHGELHARPGLFSIGLVLFASYADWIVIRPVMCKGVTERSNDMGKYLLRMKTPKMSKCLREAGAIVHTKEKPEKVDFDLSPESLDREFYYRLLN